MTKFFITVICAIAVIFNCDAYQQNFDVRTPSNVTVETLEQKFRGSALQGTGIYFLEAQERYGINAVFLAAIAMHESANGTARNARTKNNFFGIMRNGRLRKFETKRDCIMFLAYNLTRRGGLYFGKRRYTVRAIGRKYATSPHWSARVIRHMRSFS